MNPFVENLRLEKGIPGNSPRIAADAKPESAPPLRGALRDGGRHES